MFKLTRFNGEEVWINPDTIKMIEEGGDTVLFLMSGEKLLIKESPEEIRDYFIDYKKEIHQGTR